MEGFVKKIDELNADNSIKMFLDKINMLLDTYAPLKRVKKYKSKSISVKNELLTNFINRKPCSARVNSRAEFSGVV